MAVRGNMGNLLAQQGRIAESLEVFEAILADIEPEFGSDDPNTVTARPSVEYLREQLRQRGPTSRDL